MAWKDAYQYVGKILGRQDADQQNQQNPQDRHAESGRQDAALPLGARLGSVVNLQKTPLIRAISQGSLIVMPDEAETRIVAISRVQLPVSGKMYRYYLNADAEGGEKFLQLYCDADDQLQELLYCSHLTRVIPETVEDQQAFLGENGSGLGDRSYSLWRQQLADIGWDESSLDAVFADADSLLYERDMGDPGLEFVAPVKGMETRIDDAGGQHGLQQEVVFMPYRRNLAPEGGQTELLLISTEILRSRDGDATQRGIHVDFMIALPLEAERLLVQ